MEASGASLINTLHACNILYADDPWSGPPFPAGQYALARADGSSVLLIRDPLGCNKLFYGRNGSGALVLANRVDRALMHGVMLDGLASVPPGHRLRISGPDVAVEACEDLLKLPANEPFDPAEFQQRLADGLTGAFERIARRFPSQRIVVCLSGGLDSTLVADFACRRFGGRVYAASFSYIDNDDHRAWLSGNAAELASLSQDFNAARGIAGVLGIPLIPVFRPRESVLSALAPAIALCQDFRDFNVHCAIVNLYLAETIRARFADEPVVVLTGDLMNEYVCDYQEERIDGTIYYPQPRVPLATRRRFLLRGLDAGDREIGVFGAFGLPVCQPYAALARLYLQIPSDLLADRNLKRSLNAPLLRPGLRDSVNAAKWRAQVGGPDGGTLGLLHRHKIGGELLRKLWADALPNSRRGDDPWDLIQVGRYRTQPRARSGARLDD
jgi:asparagine synthetase B (glutamine-hydrolysing)